jgi:large subunit ribosomal protein L15
MLKLSNLKPYKGSTKRRKVVGRGVGSGHGTYSGKGAKGQKARSGGKIRVGFEGGNMPLQRQIPKKRGFTSRNVKAQIVNLTDLSVKFQDNETVNPKMLYNKGMIKSATESVKILGAGEITRALTFEKVIVSESAKAKIEKAGGKIVVTAPAAPAESK